MKAMTNRIFSLVLSASMLASLLPVSALAAGFTDVPQGIYYEDPVDWAVENDITSGTSGTEFSPDETCTRAQAVTFLWRSEGGPDAAGSSPFADVAAGSYYADAVQWAVANGITSGTSATAFEPDAPVTRAQVVTFLYRNAGSPSVCGSAPFADVLTGAYYRDAVRWAVTQGITAGTSANAFSPDESCTRAQIVTFLYRASDDAPDVPVIEIPEEPVLPEETVQPEQELTEEEIRQMPGEPDIEGATAAIINGLRSMEKRINLGAYNISTTDAIDLTAEISDFRGDNPYYIFSIWATLDDDNTILVVGYQYTPKELAEKLEKEAEEQAVVDAAIASCVTDGMSDYEIAKALHDYLALNNEYDMRYYSGGMPRISYTAYGALVNRTSVCAGYALAYERLMDQVGIPCEYVTGMTTRGSHAWNIIQIDGEWYHVDVTWDDPTPNREGYVRYDYFLKSDSAISRDHVSWEASRACTSTKYDNAIILSPEDEQEAIEQAEEEAKKEAIISELLALCYDQVDRLPYRTQEELQSAENISYDDTTNYIYIPADQYDYETACEAERRLVIEWMTTHPEFAISDFSREPVDGYWRIKIIRQDVYDEIDRRNAQAQADLEAQEAVSLYVLNSLTRGDRISAASASKISSALHMPLAKLFTPVPGKDKLSVTTILHHHRLLSSILSTAVKWQVIFDNPCRRVTLPKNKRKEAAFLDEDQALRMLDALSSESIQHQAIVKLLLFTGMRRAELCGLQWSDVDWEHSMLYIRRSSLYLSGKGVFKDETKNETSQRCIKISADLLDILRLHRAEQNKRRLQLGNRWQESERIFTGQFGAPIRPDVITAWVHKFTSRLGMPEIHTHSLRHTNASLLIAAGTNLPTVAKRLGHADTTTTSRIYAHAIKSADEAAADTLQDILHSSRKQA